jgi:hypothetical protein
MPRAVFNMPMTCWFGDNGDEPLLYPASYKREAFCFYFSTVHLNVSILFVWKVIDARTNRCSTSATDVVVSDQEQRWGS